MDDGSVAIKHLEGGSLTKALAFHRKKVTAVLLCKNGTILVTSNLLFFFDLRYDVNSLCIITKASQHLISVCLYSVFPLQNNNTPKWLIALSMDFKLLLYGLRDIQINVTFLTSILLGQRCLNILGNVLY